MPKYLNPLIYTVIGLLVVGLGLGYGTGRIGAGSLLFLGILVVTLGAVAVIFLNRLSNPTVSVEEMLYSTDHPTRL